MTRYSSEPKIGHLLPLGRRVSRIAEGLVGPSFAEVPQVSDDVIREAIRARRLRYRYFPDGLFGEPAWDILLELLHAQIDGRQVTVSNLCEAAGVPGTVALRWLNGLVADGLVRRRRDPQDTTSELIELESNVNKAFRLYFRDLSGSR